MTTQTLFGPTLKMGDYLTLPINELALHPDFDEDLFWAAMVINDQPMRELAERFKDEIKEYRKSFTPHNEEELADDSNGVGG